MTFATLEFNGQEKTFADWGLIQCLHQVVATGGDFFGFDVEGEPCDGPELWGYGDEVTIRRARVSLRGVINTFSGGAVVFIGCRVKTVRTGSAQFEALAYQFSGPWRYLMGNIFQMVAKTYNNGTHSLEDIYLSDLWLCQNLAGGKITTAEQLTEIISYAAARTLEQFGSAKLQAGIGFPSLNAPVDEVHDITCADAIGKMLRWSPDAVVWFDYATTPPTLNIKKRADLVAVDLAMAVDEADSIQITARKDILVPSVHFKYRQTSSFDGQNFVQTFNDIAPGGATGREFGALVATMDFDGGSVTRQTSKIDCVPVDVTSLDWWKTRHPELNDGGGALALTVLNSETYPVVGAPVGYPNELMNGQVTEWMNGQVQEVTLQAFIKGTHNDGTKKGKEVTELKTWQARCTNLNSGNYTRLTTDSLGEPIPFGLAAQFLQTINQLHFEGEKSLTEREVTYAIRMGNVLNISGGLEQWATMRALVQAVSYDWDNGKTSATFGPSALLGPGDLIELLRVNRNRWVRNYSLRQTAQSGAGDSQLGSDIPKASGGSRVASQSYQLYIDSRPGHTDSQVIIDATKAAGKTIEIIELPICIGGVSKKILVLASDPY